LSHRCGFSSYLIKKGGDIIQEQSDRYLQTREEEYLNPTTVVVTSAGSLHAKYIIHVVNPVWTGGDHQEEENLARGISNVLAQADELGVSSIAFPDLSGDIFGFPKELCAEILIRTVLEYINKHQATHVRMIKFVEIDGQMIKLIKTELQKWVVMDSLPSRTNSNLKSINHEEENEVAPLLHNTKHFRDPLKTPSFGNKHGKTTEINNQYLEEKLRINSRQI